MTRLKMISLTLTLALICPMAILAEEASHGLPDGLHKILMKTLHLDADEPLDLRTIYADEKSSGDGPDALSLTETKLTAGDGNVGDRFGINVAIDGDTAVVGAAPAFLDVEAEGAAYIFRREDGIWVEEQKLTPSVSEGSSFFGLGVAIDGATVVVGNLGENDFAGAVYVFQRGSDGFWQEEQKLTASDGQSGDQLGFQVAIHGKNIVAGTLVFDERPGAAYVFRHRGPGCEWEEEQKLTASDASAFERRSTGQRLRARCGAGRPHGIRRRLW